MMEFRNFRIPQGLDACRADVAVAKLLGFSRTFAGEILENDGVTVNGEKITKSALVSENDHIEITWQNKPKAEIVPERVDDLKIIFDDEHLIVVDKPVGVAAHPATSWEGKTVLGALSAAGYQIATSGAAERAGIVHRLDVGTTGLMVVAKTELAYSVLKKAFRERTVEKKYVALIQGHPDPLSGTIDAPVGRHPKASWKFAVVANGKPSKTHYETIEIFRGAALISLLLETGRTHQIRVHMAAQRHPCVGDTLYGCDPVFAKKLHIDRQFLHAAELSFLHPFSQEKKHFVSELPADLSQGLEILKSEQ